MATILPHQLTLSEQIKQTGPDGNLMEVVNTLEETNEMDLDAVYMQANERFSHLNSKVLSLPEIGKRRINRGAAGGVGRTIRVREFIQIFEARPKIDTLLLQSEDNPTEVRLNQIMMFSEALAQEKATALMYGDNEDDSEEINGFLTRYNDTSLSNVFDIGGSGNETASLLLVEWNKGRCNLVYPKAVPGTKENHGILAEDKGEREVTDDDGNTYDALVYMLRLAFGINVIDDRCVQRLVNIESTGTSDNLLDTGKINNLVLAINKLPSKGRNAVIYCNADLKAQFDIHGLNNLLGCTVVKDTTGAPVTMWQNRIPIRLMDAMLSTESAI